MGNIVSELTLDYLKKHSPTNFDNYEKFLKQACEANPPAHGMVWYGSRYRELASDAIWMANSLVVNAEREGYGSQRVFGFASLIPDQEMAALVKNHAIDESRHSRMFVRLTELLFPTAVDGELRIILENFSPGYTKWKHPEIPNPDNNEHILTFEDAVDELIQVNLVEIRALFLQLLLRPVALAYSSNPVSTKVKKILDNLLADEIRHIEYSARCIEMSIARGYSEFARERMVDRVAGLNEITCEEVAREEYGFCNGCKGCSRSQAILAKLTRPAAESTEQGTIGRNFQ